MTTTIPSRLLVWTGVTLHLGIGVFPLSALGLLAPAWAIVLMYGVWAAIGLAAWQTRRERPWAPLAGVVLTILIMQALLLFGDGVLGWTA